MEWMLGLALLVVVGIGWQSWRQLRRLESTLDQVLSGRSTQPPMAGPRSWLSGLEGRIHALIERFRQELDETRSEHVWFQATLRAMQDGLLVLDERTNVLLANDAAHRIFHARAPLEGRQLVELSREPGLLGLVKQIFESRQPVEREIRLEEHDMRLRTRGALITAEGQQRLLLVLRDVTRERLLESMRRDFVANVSHELRTPLTAIRGYTEALLGGAIAQPELARKFVEIVDRHARRLSRLCEDLLTLSDLELGRTALRRRPCEVRTLLEAALDTVRGEAEARQIRITLDCPAEIAPLFADPDRVEQVMVNLLENAVKYSPNGASVEIVARETAEARGTHLQAPEQTGQWIEICVCDWGEGIPSRDLPHISQRFYRVDRARSRERGGTGLGLAIVKHILQLHRGALRIESELGHGTRVRVYLPRAS